MCSGSATTSASSSTPRARRPAAPRLLPRRCRPGAWWWPASPTRRHCSATSSIATSPSSSALRPPMGGATTASASTDAGRTSPASTTAGDGRCGASGPRPPAPATIRPPAQLRGVRAQRPVAERAPRAMAFAALGAAEVLTVAPDDACRPGAARRRRPVHRTPDRQPRVAMARTTPDLRQRRPARGPPRGRRPPRRRGAPSTTACGCSAGCSTLETRDGHLSVTPGRRLVARRAPPGLRPAADRGRGPGRRVPRAFAATERRCPVGPDRAIVRSAGSSATTTPGSRCRPATGGGCDGLHADAVEREPGRRVDVGHGRRRCSTLTRSCSRDPLK